jgi:hypothetical protein
VSCPVEQYIVELLQNIAAAGLCGVRSCSCPDIVQAIVCGDFILHNTMQFLSKNIEIFLHFKGIVSRKFAMLLLVPLES